MCLDVVHSEKPKPNGSGWKVFIRAHGRLHSSICHGKFVVGKWYHALYAPNDPTRPERPAASTLRYSPGFHIFLDKADARHYADMTKESLRRVRYRGAHTLGEGGTNMCRGPQVVANSILIVKRKSK